MALLEVHNAEESVADREREVELQEQRDAEETVAERDREIAMLKAKVAEQQQCIDTLKKQIQRIAESNWEDGRTSRRLGYGVEAPFTPGRTRRRPASHKDAAPEDF